MEITKSQHMSLILACKFALSEVTQALDEGQFSPEESTVAICRIRDYNDLLEMLENGAGLISNNR